MTYARMLLSLLVLGMVPSAALAQIEDLNRRLPPDTSLVVYNAVGGQARGTFVNASGNTLTLLRRDGNVEIPFEAIERIESRRNDGVGKGAGIGFAVGGGFALLGIMACNADATLECVTGTDMFFRTALIIGGATAIGAVIDYAVKERLVLYERPHRLGASRLSVKPLVSLNTAGTRFAWQF